MTVPLSAVGGYNCLLVRRRIKQEINSPTLDPSSRPWQPIIRRTVSTEIALIATILLVTGVLTTLQPSREAFGTGIVARGQQDDLRVIVAVNPGLPALNVQDLFMQK